MKAFTRMKGVSSGAGAAMRGAGGGGDNCDSDWVAQLLNSAQAACSSPAGPDFISLPASGTVAAGATGSMTVTVQRNGFIGRRLILPDSYADAVVIDDVLVGGRSIFTSQYSLSGEIFSTKADVCSWLKWPRVSAGFDITVEFTNIRATPTAWTISTVYAVGAYVTNDGGKLYRATVGGTSAGAGGPTGTGTAIVDNTVTWTFVAALNVRGAGIEGASWG